MADDATNFQHDLDEVVNEARVVLTEMDTLKHRFDAVANKVDLLETATQKARDHTEEHISKLASTVELFTKNRETLLSDFDGEITKPYVTAMTELESKLAQLATDFQHKIQATGEAIDRSHDTVNSIGDAIKSSGDDVHDTISHTIQLLQTNVTDLRQKFDSSSHPAVNTLADLLHQKMSETEAHAQDHASQLEQLQHATDDTFHSKLYDPLHAHVVEHTEKLNEIGTGLVEARLHEQLEKHKAELEAKARQTIAQLMDKVAAELDKVAEHITNAGNDHSPQHQAMQKLLEELEPAIKPLESAVGGVKSVMSVVGL